jgi:hypothetical protein
MQLNDSQTVLVKKWVAEGCGLSEIQRRLTSEFKLSLTYMDVRFLLIDLGLELKENKPGPSAPIDLKAVPPPPPAANGEIDQEEFTNAPLPGGMVNVSVDLDRIVRAGSVASGTVAFSDGTRGKWTLDQMGRLGLDTGKPGYRPSPEDIEAFQAALTQKLQSQGY